MIKFYNKKYVFIILLFSFIQSIKSQQLITENFDYSASAPLTSNNWMQVAAATPLLNVTNAGLTYSGYILSNIGNAVEIDTIGQDVYRNLENNITVGNLYTSMMINVIKVTTTGDYFFAYLPQNSTTGYIGRLYAKAAGIGFYKIGVSKGAAINETIAYSNDSFPLNYTSLLVIKYQYQTGTLNDSVMVYNFTSGFPITEPTQATVATIGGTTADATTLGRLALRQGTASASPRVLVDGIRSATSWPNLNSATLSSLSSVFSISFSATTNSSTRISWTKNTNYADSNYTTLVFVKSINPITISTPTLSANYYTANSDFTIATSCFQNDGAAKCVFKGDSNILTITGLNPNTLYQVAVIVVKNTDSVYSPATTASFTTFSPTITFNSSLAVFKTCYGTASSTQSFLVSGNNIINYINISAPNGFEISTNQTSGFSSNLYLSPVNGIVNNVSIFLRLSSTASGYPNGNLILTSTSATTQYIYVNGSIVSKPVILFTINKPNQCLENNNYKITDTSNYCGNIVRKWFINNILYSTDSSFQYTFTNAGVYSLKLLVTNINGEKDSVTKTITVYPNPNLFITASQTSICKGQGQSVKLTGNGALNYSWTNGILNDVFFVPDTTKNYRLVGSDINGCFDTVNITIAVNPMPIIITTLDKNKITTYQFGASFQWYDCDTKSPIVNTTNQIFTATKNGNYAVIVNLNNCIDTSDCVAVLSLSHQEINQDIIYTLYPNPNNGNFTIQLKNTVDKNGTFTIMDMLGRKVYETPYKLNGNEDTISISQMHLQAGTYNIIIGRKDGITSRKSFVVVEK